MYITSPFPLKAACGATRGAVTCKRLCGPTSSWQRGAEGGEGGGECFESGVSEDELLELVIKIHSRLARWSYPLKALP